MLRTFCSLRFLILLVALVACSFTSSFVLAQTLTPIHHFGQHSDGKIPDGQLLADATGNLYGTTADGGTSGDGVVFELSPPTTAGWSETLLYSFSGPDGASPTGSLVSDSAGNLYGTTFFGGALGFGTVFQLSPPATSGGTWTETVLYSFQDMPDGRFPGGGVIRDAAGNLYGETVNGGSCTTNGGSGIVYELSPPAISGGAWTEQILYSFQASCTSHDLGGPQGGLTFGKNGSLFGVTTFGSEDTDSGGGVFRLQPPPAGQTQWIEEVLHVFTGGSDGYNPYGRLIADQKGNYYGTTAAGGTGCSDSTGCGIVFEMSQAAVKGGGWTETILYEFTGGNDGASPFAPLLFDPQGNLLGTASAGAVQDCSGNYVGGCGTVFKLTPPSTNGEMWNEITLHTFTGDAGADEGRSYSGLTYGRNGILYGLTASYGSKTQPEYGTAFKLVP